MLAKYLRTTLTCAACILLTACNFEDKNTNPNESTFIKPGPLLSAAWRPAAVASSDT